MDSNNVSYKDQIRRKLIELNPKAWVYEVEAMKIWNEAIDACEKAHNERIRNIISPLLNLILYLKNRDKNSSLEDFILSKEMLKSMKIVLKDF